MVGETARLCRMVLPGAMLATGAGCVAVASKADRPAAAAAVPFVAWVGFATLLAEQVWRRNARRSDTR